MALPRPDPGPPTLFRTGNGPLGEQLVETFNLGAPALGLLTATYFLFFAACQLPVGVLLDRFGPRRVQAALLAIAAGGALQFALAGGLPGLLTGRALIGIGTSGAFMAGLKALNLTVPAARLALANGCFVMFGGLGAMASTVPVAVLAGWLGWRGMFGILAATSLSVAACVWFGTPPPQAGRPQGWRDAIAGVALVCRDPAFCRLAPLSAMVIGTAFALHGLWAARWMADVDGVDPGGVTWLMLLMGGSLTLGAGTIGFAANALRRRGIGTRSVLGAAAAAFALVQACLLSRGPAPDWLLWATMAAFSAVTVLSFSILADVFPPDLIGRANSALNVLHIGSAFVLQCGIGTVVGLWSPDGAGRYPARAYQTALALPLALQLAALLWFAWPALARRPGGMEQLGPG